MSNLKLGVHVSKSSLILDDKTDLPLEEAVERDITKNDLNALQIYTHGPKNNKQNNIDIKKIKSSTEEYDLSVHSPYSMAGVFKSDSNYYYDSIKQQLQIANQIRAGCYVLHMTKHPPINIVNSMKILKPYAEKYNVVIGLEMVASKSSGELTYETPEKINNLIELLGKDEKYYGIVIDTAHIWAAGVDIRSYENMKKYLSEIKYKNKICLFHLNGSSSDIHSGSDKHEVVFGPEDVIWYKVDPKKSGVRAIVEFALENDITIICEIKRGAEKYNIKGINIIKTLAEFSS